MTRVSGSWRVTVPLSLAGSHEAVDRYVKGLQKHLERICPEYRPTIDPRDGGWQATFESVPAGTEQTASGKACYWIRRAVQRERTVPWSAKMIGEGIECHRSA